MQLMEAKLKQLKAKKDSEEARKKAKAAAISNPGKVEAAVEATKAVQQRAQHQVAVGNLVAQHAGNMMQHGANLMPQAPARRDNGPPVRYVDSRDTSRESNPPAAALAMPHPPRPLGIRASVDSSAHGSVPIVVVRLHTHAAAGALCFPLSWTLNLHPCAAPGMLAGMLAGPACACLSLNHLVLASPFASTHLPCIVPRMQHTSLALRRALLCSVAQGLHDKEEAATDSGMECGQHRSTWTLFGSRSRMGICSISRLRSLRRPRILRRIASKLSPRPWRVWASGETTFMAKALALT